MLDARLALKREFAHNKQDRGDRVGEDLNHVEALIADAVDHNHLAAKSALPSRFSQLDAPSVNPVATNLFLGKEDAEDVTLWAASYALVWLRKIKGIGGREKVQDHAIAFAHDNTSVWVGTHMYSQSGHFLRIPCKVDGSLDFSHEPSESDWCSTIDLFKKHREQCSDEHPIDVKLKRVAYHDHCKLHDALDGELFALRDRPAIVLKGKKLATLPAMLDTEAPQGHDGDVSDLDVEVELEAMMEAANPWTSEDHSAEAEDQDEQLLEPDVKCNIQDVRRSEERDAMHSKKILSDEEFENRNHVVMTQHGLHEDDAHIAHALGLVNVAVSDADQVITITEAVITEWITQINLSIDSLKTMGPFGDIGSYFMSLVDASTLENGEVCLVHWRNKNAKPDMVGIPMRVDRANRAIFVNGTDAPTLPHDAIRQQWRSFKHATILLRSVGFRRQKVPQGQRPELSETVVRLKRIWQAGLDQAAIGRRLPGVGPCFICGNASVEDTDSMRTLQRCCLCLMDAHPACEMLLLESLDLSHRRRISTLVSSDAVEFPDAVFCSVCTDVFT